MKVPYSVQGAMFGPAIVGLIFMLKISCPPAAGPWCFADYFARPMFMPLVSIYRIFGSVPVLVNHEPLVILAYWMLVGLLIGIILDVWNSRRSV